MDAETLPPAQVIEQLWARIQARDWSGVGALIATDAVVEWPVTGERIIGSQNYVAVNREYPEGWSIQVLGVIADGDQVASEVEVPHAGLGTFRAASFWTVTGGQVRRGTEYWTSPGSESRPAWRATYIEPI